MKNVFTLILLLFATQSFGQNASNNEIEIKKTINQLFEGMYKSDSTLLKNSFDKNAILQTIVKNKEGIVSVKNESTQEFIKSIGGKHPQYEEKIKFIDIKVDGELATVWTNYQFFVDNKFSHCGVNSFQMVKSNNSWKIAYIIDTRRKDNCPDIN
ncbi:nuclear transport factor 2 family protein [Pedobacter flavus]|uniref:Nuclear transport factor 2 family protein n=1 Tax=Pedobacter flavus TaxID=3113906 RepID=A0ABU7H0M2_9SPHI|nr:nuclear transport factor 2 family protein [Pedobacter sp. VNH31]MEE1884588.1 nuclear transport factor 2 family protein [Pedobacter sp. VNH31]